MKIGSTTGYTRSIMERVMPVAAAQGYSPTTWSAPTTCPRGGRGRSACTNASSISWSIRRPRCSRSTTPSRASPRAWRRAARPSAWRCRATMSATPDELAAMSPRRSRPARRPRGEAARGGADYIIDTVAELPALIARLDAIDTERGAVPAPLPPSSSRAAPVEPTGQAPARKRGSRPVSGSATMSRRTIRADPPKRAASAAMVTEPLSATRRRMASRHAPDRASLR
jgi:hypothetical protein